MSFPTDNISYMLLQLLEEVSVIPKVDKQSVEGQIVDITALALQIVFGLNFSALLL